MDVEVEAARKGLRLLLAPRRGWSSGTAGQQNENEETSKTKAVRY